ncbi:MAG: hypothetical protein KF795_26530 [Labilithrix sp.]|nr:hypothetical protein [Labilithrix sp.]
MSLPTSTHLDLEAQFRADATRLGAERDVAEVFAELNAAYTAPARKYHSIEHIGECLRALADVRATLGAPEEVAMAIWFHDAIYATHPFASSEKRSAELAYASCTRMGIAEVPARRIADMVLATKDHELPAKGAVDERDAAALFDIDLGILGADPVRYARFERDVRAEYSWVPEGVFRGRRAKLLRGFAARPSIYRTPLLKGRLEDAARANIDGAVRELEATVDDLVLHANDEHVFATRAARLELIHPWSDLYYASVRPGRGGTSPKLGVAFGPDDDRGLDIAVDAPGAADVIERLRSVPGYDHDGERRGATSAIPSIVYSRDRHPAIEGPVRRGPRAAYRGAS